MENKNDTMLPDDKIRENVLTRLSLAEANIKYYRDKLRGDNGAGAADDIVSCWAQTLNECHVRRAMLRDILYNKGAF
jgi:hypothetical protein